MILSAVITLAVAISFHITWNFSYVAKASFSNALCLRFYWWIWLNG